VMASRDVILRSRYGDAIRPIRLNWRVRGCSLLVGGCLIFTPRLGLSQDARKSCSEALVPGFSKFAWDSVLFVSFHLPILKMTHQRSTLSLTIFTESRY